MATHRSAEKKARQDVERRLRNRAGRTQLRNQIKKFRSAISEGDAAAAREMFGETASLIDRSAKTGVIHGNAADRTKSRLASALNGLGAKG